MEPDLDPNIRRAVEIAGSQAELAERVGLSQQQVSKILRRKQGITADVAIAIERATAGLVPRWKLRPDLWNRGMFKGPQRRAPRARARVGAAP